MRRKISLLLVVLTLLAFSFAGCSKKTDVKNSESKTTSSENKTDRKNGETKKDLTKVRVAYMANMGSASAITAAKEFGFFEEEGLDVTTTIFTNGPDEISAMASGDIDISQIGHGAHKLAIQGKAIIFQMDATSLADAVIGNKARGVSTAADLKGKKVASSLGTSADVILKLALKDAGLSESDVEIVEMDPAGVVPAMVSGQIDACATWSPGTVTIKEQLGDNAVVLADNATYVKEAPFVSSFITTPAYEKDHKDVLVKFAAAIQKAQDARLTKLDEIAKAVAKATEIDEKIMLESKNEGNWETSGTKFFRKGLEDGTVKRIYENQQKLFLEAGVIDKAVPVENYINFDIMKEANAEALK